jgi:hypothetical protein
MCSIIKDKMSHLLTITPRDIKILLFVYHYDGVIIDHIQKHFWPPDSRTPCYERVARLTKARYLCQRRLPPRTQQGTGKLWITVGSAALPLLTELLGLTSTDRRRIRHSFNPLQWEHAIEVRSLRLEIERACSRSGLFETTEWITEQTFKNDPLRVADPVLGAEAELIPDGAITLVLPRRQSRTFYIELDRASIQSPRRLRARFRGYLLADQEAPHPLLVVTPTEARVDQLRRWAQEAAAEIGLLPQSVWFTTRDRSASEDLLFDPVWQPMDGDRAALINQVITTTPKAMPSLPELHETDVSLQ